jgi:hypothetical protein
LVATPEVAICKLNIVIPAISDGILLEGERLEYLPECIVKHHSVCLLHLIEPHQRNCAVLGWNLQNSNHYNTVH